MPFKSEKQRKYLYANKPEVAAKFAKYNEGGIVMPGGLLDMKSQDMTITIKKPNGASVTYKSPEGSQVEMDGILGGMVEGYAPTPVADNKTINVTPGEFVVNFPAAQKHKGLLNMINEQGKQELAMGGWTKPTMGYANGGPVDMNVISVRKGSPQWAQLKSNPEYVEGPHTNPRMSTFRKSTGINPQPVVNTPGGYPNPNADQMIPPMPKPRPQQIQDRSKIVNDQTINATTEDSIMKQIGGKTDKKLAMNASSIMGGSNSIQDAIAKLDSGIESAESKRDAVKLMTFGLGMLSGQGLNGSINAANAIGGFNEKKINDLYADRKMIKDNVLKKKLGVNQTEFGTGWEGDDGNIYFNPNNVPEGVKIVGKAGTKNPDVPTKWVGVQTKAIEDISGIDQRLASITNILHNVPEDAWSGIFGSTEAKVKDLFGTQDEYTNWRTEVQKLRNEIAIGDLPPGVASDKDIALVLRGTPDTFINPEALKGYLAGIQKLANYQKKYKQALVDYIEQNHTGSGFKAPEFDAGDYSKVQGVVGGASSQNNNSGVDLDLSNLGG